MDRSCERVRASLAAEVVGDLSAAESAAVRGHLARCPACRRARRRLEAVLDAARRIEAPPLQAGFAEAVMARLAVEPPWHRRVRGRPRLAALAAGLVLAVSAILLPLSREEGPPPPAADEVDGRVESFVAGLDGAARRAGRTGAGALAAFADAGRQALTVTPGRGPAIEPVPIEALLQRGSADVAAGLEDAARALRSALSDLEAALPRL